MPDPMSDPCPTCQGRNRETTDMVCMTCGRDYLADEPVPGLGWKRLVGDYRAALDAERTARTAAEAELERIGSYPEGARLARWIAREAELQLRAETAQARLAAVLAVLDEHTKACTTVSCWTCDEYADIRAAAEGSSGEGN